MKNKFEKLKQDLKNLESVAIAFSGGVDSAFLLQVAYDVLGERAVAVTVQSCLFPKREAVQAEAFCKQRGIRQVVVPVDVWEIEGFSRNPQDRCYLCKYKMFTEVQKVARQECLNAVVEGSNMDDEGDYRPGHRAIDELGVYSPLRKAGLAKAEIRALSKELGLATWEKQAFACLASRFVYGEPITPEKLAMVDKAEQKLLDMGFHQLRVRMHSNMARIEVLPEAFGQLVQPGVREQVVGCLQAYGFTYVTMDLQGYRTGSMNEGVGNIASIETKRI